MTKNQLKQLMEEYIARQDNWDKDEWYGTQQEMVAEVLTNFAEELKIKLNGSI